MIAATTKNEENNNNKEMEEANSERVLSLHHAYAHRCDSVLCGSVFLRMHTVCVIIAYPSIKYMEPSCHTVLYTLSVYAICFEKISVCVFCTIVMLEGERPTYSSDIMDWCFI